MQNDVTNKIGCWRQDAARIVEELFSTSGREHWDLLLELRQLVLGGDDWGRALDVFLELRRALESDNYLPMYRLRNLLAGSLRLESVSGSAAWSLGSLLRRRHGSLESVCRAVHRETFEQARSVGELRVVEVAGV